MEPEIREENENPNKYRVLSINPKKASQLELSKVKVLSLPNLNIQSVESVFSRCPMPLLSNIDLTGNKLVCVKDMRKMSSIHLQTLKLTQNKFKEFDNFHEVYAKKLFFIVSHNNGRQPSQEKWIVRAQTSNISYVSFLRSAIRSDIVDEKTYQVLEKRCESKQLFMTWKPKP